MANNTTNSTAKQASNKLSSNKSGQIPKNAILVPVDFYPHSEAAVVFAGELADLMKLPLVILHVVHDPVDVPGFYSQKKEAKKAKMLKRLRRMEDVGAEMLDEFIHKNAKKYKKLTSLKKAYPKLVVGIPATRIMEIVKKIEPKIVVMGSHGRTGLGLAFLGSTTEHVMRQCPVSVTIVKSRKDTLEEA